MRIPASTLIAIIFVAGACVAEEAPGPDPEPLSHSFEPFEVAPGQEMASWCQSWTLGNEETIYVNAVEMTAGFGFHHSNWFWVPENVMNGPDGTWRCSDRGYNEAVAGVAGGVLFAQSTQALSEVQQFPDGVVVPIPPRSRIVGGTHLLNASGEAVETNIELTLHPLPEREVEVMLSGLSLQYQALAIQPNGRSAFTTECDLKPEHERQLQRPPDFDVYYVLPHYHDLGVRMTVEAFGEGGESLVYETDTGIGEPLGAQLSPPFEMSGFDGLRLSCEFDNPRDEVVGWGIGDQEMCIFLAFTDSELTIGGGVNSSDASGDEPTLVDGVHHYERDCAIITAPANH